MNCTLRGSAFIAVLIVLGLVQTGCYSSYTVTSVPRSKRISYAEFNLNAVARGDEKMKVVFQDNSIVEAQGIVVNQDSTTWLDPITGRQGSTQTVLIKKVIFRHSAPGEGAWVGALIGAGLGGAGAGIYVVSNPHQEMAGMAWLIMPPLGLASGTLIGLIVGAVGGHTDEYDFQNELEKR